MSKQPLTVIRPARPDDRDAVEAVVHAAYSIYVDRIGKPPGPMLDNYTTRIADGSVSVVENSTGRSITMNSMLRPIYRKIFSR